MGGSRRAIVSDPRGILRSMAADLHDLDGVVGLRSRDQLGEVVAAAQALVNAATAVQDRAIAAAAAVESAWAEDGTLVDVVRAPGHVAVDAADLLAPALGASHAQAQRRVEQAVRLAAGRVPTDGDGPGLAAPSGLTALHEAMLEGRLDGYRAGVVAHELAEAPADVAQAVVSALDAQLGVEPAAALRRRCRRLLSRISPDLLRRRAERARTESALRRWVAEPGVDAWWGTFPSEDAAAAWAAIDELARRLVTDGVCHGIDRARAKALTELVTGNATITVALALSVPADAVPDDVDHIPDDVAACVRADAGDAASSRDDDSPDAPAGTDRGHDDLVEVRGLRPSEASLVARRWLAGLLGASAPSREDAGRRRPRDEGRRERVRAEREPVRGRPAVGVRTVRCHPRTGGVLDDAVASGYRPPEQLVALVRARDGRCRFPGCAVAARFCDLDHVRPWPTGPTSADNLACLCRRHHRIKQRAGWFVRMLPGAALEWTDPTGRVRTTSPVDALNAVVLAAPLGASEPSSPGIVDDVAAFSRLEFALEHLLSVAAASSPSDANGAAPSGRRPGSSRWPDEPPF